MTWSYHENDVWIVAFLTTLYNPKRGTLLTQHWINIIISLFLQKKIDDYSSMQTTDYHEKYEVGVGLVPNMENGS